MKTKSASGNLFESVQVMRALAALGVCFGHALKEAKHFDAPDWLVALHGFEWGSGVDLFFIISGFIMMASAGSTFGAKGAGLHFFERRIVRIVPPYWFFTTAMVIVALVIPRVLDTARFEVVYAVKSYFFIPSFIPGTTNLKPILGLGWTLFYEMFFYTVFTAALFFEKRKGLTFMAVVFVALFAAARGGLLVAELNSFFGDSVLFSFLLGILVWECLDARDLSMRTTLTLFGLAVAGSLAGHAAGLGSERFFALGLPALAVFVCLYHLKPDRFGVFVAAVAIGNASYALYLVHPFAIEATKQVLVHLPFVTTSAVWFAPTLVVACMASALVGSLIYHHLIEIPVLKRLQRLLISPSPAKTVPGSAAR